jgi:hypothetical protein
MVDEERELYEALRQLPDFDCFPIPQSWYAKFNIPPRNPQSVREYINSNYAMEMAVKQKDLPPLILDEPQQGGKLVQMVQVEEPLAEVISRPFEIPDGKFPVVLPSLKDYAPDAQSHHQADTQSEQAEPSDDDTQEQKGGK